MIDTENRFDITRLSCTASDLEHIYVQYINRATPEALRALVSRAERYFLYNSKAQWSIDREWWGTIVLGGIGTGDITCGWKGWLRVDRQIIRPFPAGISIDEALKLRDERQKMVDSSGWEVSSQWGSFVFHDE